MNWMDWLVVVLFGLNAFFAVALIGKTRKPTDPITAAILVLIYAALITGIILTHTDGVA